MGVISSISTIYDKKGNGWDNVNTQKYFRSGDQCEDNATQPLMTTSHQFEENIILLETMAHITLGRTMENDGKHLSQTN
jgi:hypothetical protein